MKRALLVLAALLLAPGATFAQQYIQNGVNGTNITAANQCAVLTVGGYGTGSAEVLGTFTGTVSFTVSNSADNTGTAVLLAPPNSSSTVSSTTASGRWAGSVASWKYFRACAGSSWSGTANIILGATPSGGGGSSTFSGSITAGAQPANDPHYVRASDGTNALSAFPVSGTVTANAGTGSFTVVNAGTFAAQAAQSGTWTVQPGNTANTTAWLVTGTGGTFPVTQSVGTNLHVVVDSCTSGCSSSTAPADASAFTASTTPQSPVGGFFQTTATNNALTNGQMGAWQFTANRAGFVNLRNASGTEIGTSTTPVQVSLANTGANGTAVAVSLASVPSHAVTNAGTFLVQENGAALTALQLIDNPVGSSTGGTAGTSSFLAGGIYNSTPPTLTNGQQAAFQFNSSGALLVSGSAGGTSLADGGTFTASTTSATPASAFYESSPTTCTSGKACAIGLTTNRELKVALYASGSPLTQDTQAQQDVAIASGTIGNATGGFIFGRASSSAPSDVSAGNDAVLPWHLLSGAYVTNPSYAGTLASTGNGASGGGVPRVTLANDSTGVVGLNAGTNMIGFVKDAPSTPILANALSTSVATVTGSAGILTSYFCSNPNSSAAYVQVFDISGSVTLGTSTPKWSLRIPPNDGAANLAGLALNFANAIKVAATTTATGSSAPSTALDCNFAFR